LKLAFIEGVGHFRRTFREVGDNSQQPPIPIGVERLEISLFRMVLRYWQTTISFCHNTCIWQMDRIETAILCVTCSCMV